MNIIKRLKVWNLERKLAIAEQKLAKARADYMKAHFGSVTEHIRNHNSAAWPSPVERGSTGNVIRFRKYQEIMNQSHRLAGGTGRSPVGFVPVGLYKDLPVLYEFGEQFDIGPCRLGESTEAEEEILKRVRDYHDNTEGCKSN